MGDIFKLAKEFTNMPQDEIEELLDNPFYEVRMGGVSIMDFQARNKRTPEEHRKALFDLYMRRHDRLNNWDFIDRASYNVIGKYLENKPREILYDRARSNNIWERRTSIVSTYHFIKQGDLDETFHIAEILINDQYELINKAVGSWIREAGKKDEERLRRFLAKHAQTMPRITLRYAIEKLDKKSREHYLKIEPER